MEYIIVFFRKDDARISANLVKCNVQTQLQQAAVHRAYREMCTDAPTTGDATGNRTGAPTPGATTEPHPVECYPEQTHPRQVPLLSHTPWGAAPFDPAQFLPR